MSEQDQKADKQLALPLLAFVSSFTPHFTVIRKLQGQCMIKMTFPAISWPWHNPITMTITQIDFSCRLFVTVSITNAFTSGVPHSVRQSRSTIILPAHSCISSPPPFVFAFHSYFSHSSNTTNNHQVFELFIFNYTNSHIFAYASNSHQQKCLPKQLRRSPPLAARPQLAKPLPLRRRKLARRLPPLHLVTRRSEERPERRLTHHTSTRVCSFDASFASQQ